VDPAQTQTALNSTQMEVAVSVILNTMSILQLDSAQLLILNAKLGTRNLEHA
jgi:hypothetical protein